MAQQDNKPASDKPATDVMNVDVARVNSKVISDVDKSMEEMVADDLKPAEDNIKMSRANDAALDDEDAVSQ